MLLWYAVDDRAWLCDVGLLLLLQQLRLFITLVYKIKTKFVRQKKLLKNLLVKGGENGREGIRQFFLN